MLQKQKSFLVKGRQATLYTGSIAGAPLVVLNTYTGNGESIICELAELGAPECSLLVISNLNWNHDMTPWPCPSLSANDTPFTGGAEEYLRLLHSEILPRTLDHLAESPAWIGIAGYSLAGLFAIWTMHVCDTFGRAASMSGSLWFPDFLRFIEENEPMRRPSRIYFSLGDKEAETKNTLLCTVRDNTTTAVSYYRALGLDVKWELNPGNHFKDCSLRTARGIKAILD